MDELEHVSVSQSSPHPVVENQIRADQPDAAPSQAAVALALSKKQEKIESSDEVKEGKENLYFTEVRVFDAVHEYIDQKVALSVLPKQDQIKSSDEIKEGQAHQYFKPERAVASVVDYVASEIKKAVEPLQAAIESTDDIPEGKANLYFSSAKAMDAAILVCPKRLEMKEALSQKQDLIKSADDISEGVDHKFFDEKQVEAIVGKALTSYQAQVDSLLKAVKALQAEVEELKPKWSDALMGGTGKISVVTAVTRSGIRSQDLIFKAGVLSDMGPVSSPKQIGSE